MASESKRNTFNYSHRWTSKRLLSIETAGSDDVGGSPKSPSVNQGVLSQQEENQAENVLGEQQQGTTSRQAQESSIRSRRTPSKRLYHAESSLTQASTTTSFFSTSGRWSLESMAPAEVTSAEVTPRSSRLTSQNLSRSLGSGDSESRTNAPQVESNFNQMSDSSEDKRSLNDSQRIPKLQNIKAQLVTFYRNGDKHHKGYETAVGRQYFASLGALKTFLGGKIPLDTGFIKYILALPYGDVVRDLSEFRAGRGYVVANTQRLIQIDYVSAKAQQWDIRQPSGGRSKFKAPVNPSRPPQVFRRPRVLQIASNTNRGSIRKFYLDRKTPQLYEDFLKDVQDGVDLESPPLTALYTASPRHRKVKGFAHLHRELKAVGEFLACGRELYPDINAPYPQFKDSADSRGSDILVRGEPGLGQTSSGDIVTGHSIPRPNGHSGSGSDVRSDVEDDVRDDVGETDRYQTHGLSASRRVVQNTGLDSLSDVSTPSSCRSVSTQTSPDPPPSGRGHHPEADENDQSANEKPDKDLLLEWVYGYRGRDTVNSLRMLPDGRLVYYVAAVVVLLDRKSRQQRHYTEHTEDITCLTVRTEKYRTLVATGQLIGRRSGRPAHIRVWDPVTMETQSVIGESVLTASVCAVGFTGSDSADDILFAVDESSHHVIRVWDWQQNKVLAKTMSSSDTVVWGGFHPSDSSVLITLGRRHLYFWRVLPPQEADDIGQILRDVKSGSFPESAPQFLTSLEFSSAGDVITGDSDGRLWVWSRGDAESPFTLNERCSHLYRYAHKGTIFALTMLEDDVLLSASDNCIKAWNTADSFTFIQEVKVPSLDAAIRTITPQVNGSVERKLYLGTTGNDILEGTLRTQFEIIVEGHHDELTALTSVPGEADFLTIGQDCEVRKWDAENHSCDWTIKMDRPCTAIAVDNLGRQVALGTPEGRLIVMRMHDGRHVTSVQIANTEILTLKYSPDNTFLALGCKDGNIYVYSVHDKGSVYRKHLYGVLQGHEQELTELDWSCDGRHLQSMAGNVFLYWCVTNMSSVASDTSRHIEWFTHTCVGGHSFSGSCGGVAEDDTMLCTDRATSDDVMVIGDVTGALCVYRYPCNHNESPRKPASGELRSNERHLTQSCHVHRVNSGAVNDVTFLYGDSHVVSLGGLEGGIFQWRVIDV